MLSDREGPSSRRAGNVVRPLFAFILLFPFLLSIPVQAKSQTVVYPAAPGEPLSTLFAVTVAGQPSPVYLASVGSLTGPTLNQELVGKASFTSFDINGAAQVSVAYSQPVKSAKILPATSGVVLSVSGNQVTFSISSPAQLTLEINGDWNNSLHLFANPLETNVPAQGTPNVIYYGPGIHIVSNVQVTSGQTVYIAGGAVLYGVTPPKGSFGALFVLSGSNITFRGRGIIDTSRIPQISNGDIIYANVNGLQVEGVTLRDSGNWTFHINESKNVQVSNIKVFGWRLNSDGTDVDSSENVLIKNSFYRTYDDLIAVKTNSLVGQSTNITVRNCVLWNEKGHALTVGAELMTNVSDVYFTDSVVIHDKGHDTLLSIFNGDAGTVSNVIFENLNVEESMWLASLYIGQTNWSAGGEFGHINAVTFRNIVAAPPSRPGVNIDLQGLGPANQIDNVAFQNVLVGGIPVLAEEITQNQFVSGINVVQ